jgi:energy-coupling factor transport system ATP-binding protein
MASLQSGQKPLVIFKDFTFKYRAQKRPTLYDINLCIYPGEKILIAGPSGSGKSTLGSCLNGLIPFNYPGTITGELTINGLKPQSVFQLSEFVGSVLQDTDAQFVGLSSGEDIAFALENKTRPQDEMKTRVLEVAKLVGADGYLTHSPQRLSGGQKQRVGMAGVLIENTDILLLDEPLAALDPSTGKLAIALIDEISAKTGCTVVIIEHRLEDVLWKQMDRVILVNAGRIVEDCTPDEIVISEKLQEAGVRRPLYVSALGRAGIDVCIDMKPGRINTLKLTDDEKEKIHKWADTEKAHDSQLSTVNSQVSPPLLEARCVGFTYDETETAALGDVSFKLYPGEMTAIVGANGAGKSTLAKLIVGFESLDKGEIFYNGEGMCDMTIPERAERIGYVMQNPNQMICKPMIFDEIALGLRVRGLSEPEIKERVERVLEVCGLTRFINWPISALSYGQKKRVTIADALVLNPQVIILDEPTAGQDWRHYTDIMEFLAKLNQSGVTVLLITHDMHLCLEYAKRALVFSGGRLLVDKPAYEVLSDPVLAASANLRETSLYELSRMCGLEDARTLVRAYIDR